MSVACPGCGESEDLRGERSSETITIVCGACGTSWERDTRRRCSTCGRADLRPAPKAVMQKVRGNQRSIVGTVTVHLCPDCDRETIDRHLRSRAPIPPDDPTA